MVSKLRAVAYHEAGHAVACLHYGLGLVEVFIKSNGDGLTRRRSWARTEFDELVSTWCGPLAEYAATGGPVEVTYTDKQVIRKIERALGQRASDRAVRAAVRIIEEKWRVIEVMAEALRRRGRLSGAEIAHLDST